MDEKKEEQKNDIILVVKKAIGDKVEIDDIIDSEDVDIIAKKVADRLYMDGWRKENPQRKSKDEKTQIEEIEKMAYSICAMGTVSEYITDCNKCGYYNDCLRLAFAKRFYEAGYRKADEVIDRLMNAKTTSGLTEKEIEFFVKHNEKVRKETAKEILDEVSRHFGGAWLAELYKKYGIQ